MSIICSATRNILAATPLAERRFRGLAFGGGGGAGVGGVAATPLLNSSTPPNQLKQGCSEKSLMSVIFPLAIPVPEMAAPTFNFLWAPGSFRFFLLGNPHAHKIPRFRGGGVGVFWKGGG